jgi:hypothetical protein
VGGAASVRNGEAGKGHLLHKTLRETGAFLFLIRTLNRHASCSRRPPSLAAERVRTPLAIRYSCPESGAHMFKKKTVFILGAGASWHYGYPTGEELVRMVIEKASDIDFEYDSPLPSHDGSGSARQYSQAHPKHFANSFDQFLHDLKTFRDKALQANPLVIDDFLGRNEGVADIGKLLIAMVLIDCEAKHEVRSGNADKRTGKDTGIGDWVRYIVQQLTVDCEKPEDLLANQVAFVSFNYDLSLETRLHQALKNYQYFANSGFSDKFFTKERFLHVYGQLYDFDPKRPSSSLGVYGNTLFPFANQLDRAHDAAQNIRTISPDEKTATPEIVEAITEAEYLYFLGYGFDRRNNELLGLGHLQGEHRQYVNFTNYKNCNKVSKSVERIYAPVQGMSDINGVSLGSLLGDSYMKRSYPSNGVSKFTCEKSIKSVYDALAEDFDWPK